MSKNHKKGYASRERLGHILSVLKKHNIIKGLTPEKLKNILEDLGPTFVKLGQIMSMRSDVLPASYCKELKKLRTNVKSMEFSEVKEILESEYGVPLRYIFSSIEEKPLGSASMAQVHIATLKTEEEVVVKVQRPDIYTTMAQDIGLLKRAVSILKVIGNMGENIDFSMILEEMWIAAQKEMNFIMEASNLKEFAKLNEDVEYVKCPKVNEELTTSKVLVMENIKGVFVDNIKDLNKLGYDLREIAIKLGDNYIKQVIEDGFFHADPHPGNIIISKGKIVWIDLGMVGRLSNYERTMVSNALIAIVKKDSYELKNSILAMCIPTGEIDHGRLQEDIEGLLEKYGDLEVGDINLGNALQEIMDIMKKHNINMASGLSLLIRGIITIEGVLVICCPEVSFIEILEKHIISDLFDNFDIKKEVGSLGRAFYNVFRKSLDIPVQISDMLKMTIKGQTKINLDLKGSEEPINRLDKMMDKLIICIISSAFLIGSSLIITTDMQIKIMGIPALGFIGYVISIVLGLWLIYTILKKK